MSARTDVPRGEHPQVGNETSNTRLYVLLGLFLMTAGAFGKHAFDAWYIPAYGDTPEDLEILGERRPTGLVCGRPDNLAQ